MSKEEIKIKLHSLVKITNNGDSVSIERMFDVEADFILKLIEIEKRKYALNALKKIKNNPFESLGTKQSIEDKTHQLEQEINQLETELK